MNGKYLRLSLVAGVVGLLIAAACAQAETLKEVIDSPEMQKFSQKSANRTINEDPAKWFKPDTNMAKIFLEPDGPEQVLEWLGNPTFDFKTNMVERKRTKQFIFVERFFQTLEKSPQKIRVTVLLPHPKYLPAREMGLMQEFNDMVPPGSKVASTEKLEIRGSKATLYQRKDGACSLLFHLSQGSMVNLYSEECSASTKIVKLAELLDIHRLDQKLQN